MLYSLFIRTRAEWNAARRDPRHCGVRYAVAMPMHAIAPQVQTARKQQGRQRWRWPRVRLSRNGVAAEISSKNPLALSRLPRSALHARLSRRNPWNIGGLYPVTGNFAQIGQGCVNAAKLAVQMVNDAGGIKVAWRGQAEPDRIRRAKRHDVTRTETDRLISGYKLSAIHGCFASALTLIASEVAETREDAALDRFELGPTQQRSSLYVHRRSRARRSSRWRNCKCQNW